MLQLQNIQLYFGERALLRDASFIVNPGERVALTGPNGAGKSTLLRIIAGEQEADAGAIHLSGTSTIGYLPQDGVDPDPGLTVFEETERAFQEILDLRQREEQLRARLSKMGNDESSGEDRDEDGDEDGANDALLNEYGMIQTKLENAGHYTLQSDIERVLSGLGFRPSDLTRSTTEFSGGWLMRIALAKLLLRRPTYLLLDEPTNHLDIESLQWLESFMKTYDGALIIVSHDKAFLNSVTTRTLHVKHGDIRDYAGNYSFFERKAAEERELLLKKAENQKKELEETRRFIERFRYKATKAKQVQSRIRQLEKIEEIRVDEETAELSFQFPAAERSGRVVLELSSVTKRYGNLTVFENLDLAFERGDKIAVVGPNGAGKSTLIQILAGVLPVTGGTCTLGHNVIPGYFAQHQAEELDPKKTALEEMQSVPGGHSDTRLRTLLGCFLFAGDDVFKPVKVLSGGERSRLALAKMLLNPGNFLIFDEPTNHLDMQSKAILRQALQQFDGTLLIVSHDRDFLDPIVNKTLEIQPGHARYWLGDVSYYLRKKQEMDQQTGDSHQPGHSNHNSAPHQPDKPSATQPTLSRKEERRLRAEKRALLSEKINPLKKRLEELENAISNAEERKQTIETDMADPSFYENGDRVKQVSLEYESLKQALAENLRKWEEIAGRIEFLEEEADRQLQS
ncbi:MAG: ABC transporter ATP-binding protein [Bacteroidetes bacterium]|nr:MAG: ABC transporter ATP-binding protein [Bacteroidota bacterium]